VEALGILGAQCIRTSYFWCSNRYWFQLFAFAEAIALVNMEACTAVNNQQELNRNLIRNEDIRHEKDICSTFVQMNKGATQMIVSRINNCCGFYQKVATIKLV
jgi:hypothetical protein